MKLIGITESNLSSILLDQELIYTPNTILWIRNKLNKIKLKLNKIKLKLNLKISFI